MQKGPTMCNVLYASMLVYIWLMYTLKILNCAFLSVAVSVCVCFVHHSIYPRVSPKWCN